MGIHDKKDINRLKSLITDLAGRALMAFTAALMAGLLLQTSVVASDQSRARQMADSLEQEFSRAPGLEGFNLEDYLTFAAANSAGLKASFHRWRVELEKIPQVTSLPDPVLSYGRFTENVETRVGPQRQKFSLRQSIPWFGTLGDKGDAQFQTAQAAFARMQAKKLSLYYRVKSAYYDYYYLGRQIALTQENLELLKFWESVLRTRYQVAAGRNADVIKIQVELGKLEDRVNSLREMTKPVSARLRAVLNLPDSTNLPVPQAIVEDDVKIDHAVVRAEVRANSPRLRSQDFLVMAAKAERRVAGKSARPSFTIGADYIETGPAMNPLLDASGKDAWMLSVGVNVPLWFGKNKAAVRQARAKQHSVEYERKNMEEELLAYTESVLFAYEDARRKIGLYRDGLIAKARQSINVSYSAYEGGEVELLTVLDTQRQLLEFELQLQQSLTERARRLAELEMLTAKQLQ